MSNQILSIIRKCNGFPDVNNRSFPVVDPVAKINVSENAISEIGRRKRLKCQMELLGTQTTPAEDEETISISTVRKISEQKGECEMNLKNAAETFLIVVVVFIFFASMIAVFMGEGY